MPDVFVSYSREDKARAEAIATALQGQGYDVFWDNEIPPGSTWADYLQAKISNAKALVVLWTATSTQSQWVREEARIGRDSRKLVPIILDGAAPPFGFGEVQAVDLTAWDGNQGNPEWQRFLKGLSYVVQQSGGAAPTPTAPARSVAMPAASTPSAGGGGGAATAGAPKFLIYGGLGVIAAAAVAAVLLTQSPPTTPGQPGAPVAVSTPSAPTFSPAVRAVVDRARAAQVEARTAAVAARTNADLGRQAARAADAGQPGFGMQAMGSGIAKGDLIGLQASRPSPVVITPGDGSEFAGLMQGFSQTQFNMNGVNLEPGGVSFQGRVEAANQATRGVGVSVLPGKFTLEGAQRGSMDSNETTGEAVVSYANGERYEGEYRVAGSGATAVLYRHGLGAHYGANGALINAGRFDNDRYVGAQ